MNCSPGSSPSTAWCDEDEINRRLAAVTDDVAGVRRMLVDTGWLERDRAGTTYGPGRPLPHAD